MVWHFQQIFIEHLLNAIRIIKFMLSWILQGYRLAISDFTINVANVVIREEHGTVCAQRKAFLFQCGLSGPSEKLVSRKGKGQEVWRAPHTTGAKGSRECERSKCQEMRLNKQLGAHYRKPCKSHQNDGVLWDSCSTRSNVLR